MRRERGASDENVRRAEEKVDRGEKGRAGGAGKALWRANYGTVQSQRASRQRSDQLIERIHPTGWSVLYGKTAGGVEAFGGVTVFTLSDTNKDQLKLYGMYGN
jgi:hypothetical protein